MRGYKPPSPPNCNTASITSLSLTSSFKRLMGLVAFQWSCDILTDIEANNRFAPHGSEIISIHRGICCYIISFHIEESRLGLIAFDYEYRALNRIGKRS